MTHYEAVPSEKETSGTGFFSILSAGEDSDVGNKRAGKGRINPKRGVRAHYARGAPATEPPRSAPPPPTPPPLTVKVLTYNRPASLERLLKSLEEADYLDDTVALEIYVDGVRDKDKAVGGDPKRDQCVALARAFAWSHGPKTLFLRRRNVGLVGQWLTCHVHPKLYGEFVEGEEEDLVHQGYVVILEDDMQAKILWEGLIL